jgi:UTP--glucose-1-phosphate uridylyltransferase
VRIRKAVITAAAESQRALPLQTLTDRDGQEKSVLRILMEQALAADVEEVCIITWPGDETRYTQAIGQDLGRVRFIPQPQPLGYGHAVYCANEFVRDEPFLHMVGDHLYISHTEHACAQSVVELAKTEDCAVSAVQATRETLLHMYGAVGGRRFDGTQNVYRIDTVIEKPTPTGAEQRLIAPGLRAGHYLCFFGIHVLTPTVMETLGRQIASSAGQSVKLSPALADLARKEQYLACDHSGRRYDIGARYGLLTAQLALALSSRERSEVLSHLVELLADRELNNAAETQR